MPNLRADIAEIATIGGQVCVRCTPPLAPRVHPGQFFLARLDTDALLRLPLFPTSASEFVVDESHPIAALNPGDSLDLIGPLGAGFRLPGGSAHLLIVAEQPARMLMVLRTALDQHWSAAWLWATAVPGWAATLLPSEVEFHTGPLAPELCEWADVIVLDVAGAKEIAARVREMRPLRPTDFVRAVCAPLMPCGVGACQACWVPTRHGKRLACVDGPIFAI